MMVEKEEVLPDLALRRVNSSWLVWIAGEPIVRSEEDDCNDRERSKWTLE